MSDEEGRMLERALAEELESPEAKHRLWAQLMRDLHPRLPVLVRERVGAARV